MARIPGSELERLKRALPIVGLVSGFEVELQRHGAELIGACPFHNDKSGLQRRRLDQSPGDAVQGERASSTPWLA